MRTYLSVRIPEDALEELRAIQERLPIKPHARLHVSIINADLDEHRINALARFVEQEFRIAITTGSLLQLGPFVALCVKSEELERLHAKAAHLIGEERSFEPHLTLGKGTFEGQVEPISFVSERVEVIVRDHGRHRIIAP